MFCVTPMYEFTPNWECLPLHLWVKIFSYFYYFPRRYCDIDLRGVCKVFKFLATSIRFRIFRYEKRSIELAKQQSICQHIRVLIHKKSFVQKKVLSKNIQNMKNLETVVFNGILTQKWLQTAAIHFGAVTEFDFTKLSNSPWPVKYPCFPLIRRLKLSTYAVRDFTYFSFKKSFPNIEYLNFQNFENIILQEEGMLEKLQEIDFFDPLCNPGLFNLNRLPRLKKIQITLEKIALANLMEFNLDLFTGIAIKNLKKKNVFSTLKNIQFPAAKTMCLFFNSKSDFEGYLPKVIHQAPNLKWIKCNVLGLFHSHFYKILMTEKIKSFIVGSGFNIDDFLSQMKSCVTSKLIDMDMYEKYLKSSLYIL